MSSEKSSEAIEKIVEKAQTGHNPSLELLYDLFFNKIYRYISFKVSPDYVEDLVADVFLKMLKNIKKYKNDKSSSFSAWVYRLARNHVIDFYRKKKELLSSDLEDDNLFLEIEDKENLPDTQLLKTEELEIIKAEIEKLSPNSREILQLKFFDDLSNKEICEITGKSEGNIRIIQLRALKILREKLG